ncbi:MAG: ABC transporter ATP-binding protein [Thermodesulfobacteriota bacterium]
MLELKDLTVFYGDAQAVKELSLRVEEGTLAAIVGANGAGKSTTLMTVSGLIHPRSGTVKFMEEDLLGLRPEEIVERGISLVPEGRWLFSRMTVAENLRLGAYAPRARDKASGSLQFVFELFPDLRSRCRKNAASLSGGEQQMLAIGRALMSRPRFLMLDEPSLGLAPLVVARMFDVIRTLLQEGVTILLVEQNVRESLKLAETGFVMKTGRLTLSGPGDALLQDPRVQKAFLGIGKDPA